MEAASVIKGQSNMVDVSHHNYSVQWSTEEEEYVGFCAEYSGLSWFASTPEEALSGILKIVRDADDIMK